MFSCEPKFAIDLLKKWLAEKYFGRYKEVQRRQRWMKKLQFLFTPNICIFFYRDAVGELPELGDTTRLNKKIQKGFCNYQPSLKAKSTD